MYISVFSKYNNHIHKRTNPVTEKESVIQLGELLPFKRYLYRMKGLLGSINGIKSCLEIRRKRY